jgi:glucose/arabinose dehydrogenase
MVGEATFGVSPGFPYTAAPFGPRILDGRAVIPASQTTQIPLTDSMAAWPDGWARSPSLTCRRDDDRHPPLGFVEADSGDGHNVGMGCFPRSAGRLAVAIEPLLWSRAAVLTRLATIVVVAIAGAHDAGAELRTTVHASGFRSPVAFVQDPADDSVQFVVEQGGRIRVVQSGIVLRTDFLDLSAVVLAGGERGLLGLAFPPNAAVSGRFFVNFTDAAGNTVVARFHRSENALVADPASRFDLQWGQGGPRFIKQPFANHNGGHLAFGPDGYLYVGLGDGGSGGDPGDYAQNPAELLGKMLRIDVDVDDSDSVGYAVPGSNPFQASDFPGIRTEIWAFGLRNPWRYSFDEVSRGGSGALIIADVGQDAWEEIDYQSADRGGRNYGWRNREGAHNYNLAHPPAVLPLTEPIYEYSHSEGQSITGGYVYRGSALGEPYRGRYFFADFISGRVWSIALAVDEAGEGQAADVIEHTAEFGDGTPLGNISSFGVDALGELYIVGYSRGTVLRVLPVDVGRALPDPCRTRGCRRR